MIVEDDTCEASLCRFPTSAESCPKELGSYGYTAKSYVQVESEPEPI